MANQKDFRVKNGLVVEEGAIISGLSYPTTDGSEGYVLTTDGSGNLTFQLNPITAATGEPMGFVARTDSTISFNNSTRTFAIAPVSVSYEVWTKGVKRTITTSTSVTIPNTTGLYYICYQPDGTLIQQTSFFDLQNQTPVAYVYWNATTSSAPFVADERHGVVLDWQTHEYLHRTRGAVIASGFAASNYVVGGNGSLDSHLQLNLDGGTFYDEDLKVQIVHSNTPTNIWEQDLQGPAKIPMFYINGNGAWTIDAPTDFPVKQGVDRPQYNLNTAGTWTTEDVGENKYGVTFILATNNIQYPIIGILGQNAKYTLGDAEAISFADLVLTGFPVVEFRPLYKLVYKCATSISNTPSATLSSIWDLRSISSVSSTAYIASDHGALSGLTDDDHTQYVHTTYARTITADHNFTGNLNLSGTSINKLMDVDTSTVAPTSGQALIWNGTNFVPGDVTANFLGLTDTPNSYTSQGGRIVQVKADATGLEFGDVALGSASRDIFTANGSQTTFTVTNTYGGQNSILVFVNGVPQWPGTNFTFTGSSLVFTSAPDTNAQILVYGLTPITNEITPGDGTVTAKKIAASAYTRDVFTGTGSQATFNLSGDVGSLYAPFVFVGGIIQDPITHYDISLLTNPQTITFTEAIPLNTEVTVVYGTVSVTGTPSDGAVTFAKLAPSNFAYSVFTGNGAQVSFTMTQSVALPQQVIVTVAGVPQSPDGTSYTVSNTTLTFSSAPASGAKIVIRYYGSPLPFGTPGDNTVSTIKVVDGAITPAKLDRAYATPTDVSTAIAGLVNSAPLVLDTLSELATAVNNDASFGVTITNKIIEAEAASVAMAIALG